MADARLPTLKKVAAIFVDALWKAWLCNCAPRLPLLISAPFQ
jgi:hypothetical protein